jgi:MFS transporter, OFA family, oxalate/formate antiporter
LLDEFKLTNEEVSQPAFIMLLLVAVLAALVGFLLDRFSPKAIMVGGALVLLGCLLALASVTAFVQVKLIYVAIGLGLTAAGIVSSMYLITKWFQKYRGLAVGIFLMGSSFGGAVFNKVAGWGMAQYDWRTAALILLGCGVVVMLLPLLLLVRNRPQDLGLLPDGAAQVVEGTAFRYAGPTLGQAAQSPQFYLLLFSTAALWFCIMGVINHQVLFIEKDLGHAKPLVTNVTSLFFLCSVIGKVLFGFLGDRYDKKTIMLISVVNLLIGSVLLRFLHQLPTAALFAYAFMYGVAFSGAFTMIQVVIAERYHGSSYGKILGIFTMIDTLAGSAGIILLGKWRRANGDYFDGFNLMIALCVIACLCVLFIRKPAPPNLTATHD